MTVTMTVTVATKTTELHITLCKIFRKTFSLIPRIRLSINKRDHNSGSCENKGRSAGSLVDKLSLVRGGNLNDTHAHTKTTDDCGVILCGLTTFSRMTMARCD
jgi:hypothetical protein